MNFISYINSNFQNNFITEEVSSNSKGVMHELLVGYHLNNKQHMERHPDVNGLSPKEAHDSIKKQMTPDGYRQANEKARIAAEDIKKRIGGPIHHVHWTSKPGDLGRSTGIHASQKEDASDIVVTTRDKTHKSGFRHHGISLKITDKNKEVPVSNPGIESTHGGKEIIDNHRKEIDKAHPKLAKLTSKSDRKEFVKNNPKVAADIKRRNTETLNKIADNMHKKLSKLKPNELANHIREHVLHAHQTPMQREGHNHIRHTTYGDNSHSAVDPSQSHEHILSDPKNITVHRSGTSVIFSHNGVPFARHRIKFESQSDPKSTIKGSGEIIKSKQKPAAASSSSASTIDKTKAKKILSSIRSSSPRTPRIPKN